MVPRKQIAAFLVASALANRLSEQNPSDVRLRSPNTNLQSFAITCRADNAERGFATSYLRSGLADVFKIVSTAYPETLHQMVIVNPPAGGVGRARESLPRVSTVPSALKRKELGQGTTPLSVARLQPVLDCGAADAQ